MKTINRRALAALVFGFLTLGAGASFAQEPAKNCCTTTRCGSKSNWIGQWAKAKYGRDFPAATSASQNRSNDCCKHCC